jgi:hypothetical protein
MFVAFVRLVKEIEYRTLKIDYSVRTSVSKEKPTYGRQGGKRGKGESEEFNRRCTQIDADSKNIRLSEYQMKIEEVSENALIRELKIGKIRGFLKQALYLCPSVVKKGLF